MSNTSENEVAVVHEHHPGRGGGERVAEAIAETLDSPLYTGYATDDGHPSSLDVKFHELFDEKWYARLDRMAAPFTNANVGRRSKKALENAKEKYGAGWSDLNTKQVLVMSFAMALLGLGMGYVVFFGL